jgi:hypothetical protein
MNFMAGSCNDDSLFFESWSKTTYFRAPAPNSGFRCSRELVYVCNKKRTVILHDKQTLRSSACSCHVTEMLDKIIM